MAIDLGPNTNYELLSGDHLCQDKVIVHVKLTDSCLRALQGFKNVKGSSKRTPLIKFTGQNGRITIPTSRDETQQFMFNSSTLQPKDSQGCLDCIQHSKNDKSVMSFGSINHKINVLATDDSYKMTQDRMKVAEEQRQEVRTKVINTPGKVKKNRHITRQHNILNSVKGKIPNMVKVSNGANKSLRDRVIHLLAIRPFKKPELIGKLSKDGVRLDKNALTHILQQVTSLDNNKYNLLRHIYPEIKIDSWPYSNNEKQIVQKRITNSQVDTTKSYLQKSDSNGEKHLQSVNKKRPSESTTYTDPVNKKQRIARVINNNVTSESRKDTRKETKQRDVSSKNICDKTDKQATPTTHEKAPSVSHLDYKKKYQPITTYEQRLSYRRDFEVEFKEYQEIQSKINAVTKKFEELKGNLEKCPQNSRERDVIEKQVVALYQKQQQDPSWEINKKRCRDLHSKLAYIKELIKDYDGKRHDT